jgi:small conductance mechanosensitive channel
MGSVLKSAASFAIFVLAGLMVLSELGLDLAPLIASAGIAGIALGFGAQNLVKDFLAGVFMIFEDQYGVGDVIDTGEATGSVEAVGLRVTQLRDVDGVVWYVRNGEVIRIGNKSQGWARAVLDIGVGYGEDIAMVRTLLKEVADTLWRDPEWAELVVEEPEVWGVEAMGPDAVLVRVAVKTQPLEQWKVARELRERIKAAFDERGIEIPFPQRTVWMRTEGPGTAPPAPAPDAPDVVPAGLPLVEG